jgi:hypothetical protein
MMRHRHLRVLAVLPLAFALLVVTSAAPGVGVRNVSASPLDKLDPRLRAHVSTTADIELGGLAARAQTAGNYFPSSDDGCPTNRADNVKVNQNCVNVADASLQGRSQAQNETSIAVDPSNPSHLVGSYNDYRRGDGNCGGSFSLDGGRSWADTTTPTGFTSGALFGAARQYWQAGGDTSVAWDTRGNAYMSCQVFQRGAGTTTNPDLSSAFTVFRSTGNNGASWNFPAHFTTFNNDVAGSGAILEDKALMTVDNHVGSPFRDRIYVTWTEFTPTTAYIYEVASNDYGQSFGPRQLVSATSTLCRFPISGPAGGCDNNQFSDPFTGPDGALYVTWANYNTVDFSVANPGPAKFQMLIAKSTDGGSHFSAPQLAGTYYELPDCATYTGQDGGRACVPEKASTSNSIFRATQYPAGAVNPRNPSEVAVSFGSYINRNSNEENGCVPTGSSPSSTGGLYTGVRTPGACNNDILLSVSKDAGATFTGTAADPRSLTTVTPTSRQATSDQWFQWLAYTGDGRLAVSYYDRQYGSDETTGFSDFSLSGSRDLVHFGVTRATSSSLPPPTQFSGLFLGDYTGLDASSDRAFPIWSDTRGRELFLCPNTAAPGVPPQLCGLMDPNGPANDEDIFAAGVEVPGGR